MAKLSGKSGRIKIGSALTITGATYATGLVTVTAANALSAGMFVLISGVVGMTDLNNSGKGFLVTFANSTTSKVALTTAQTYTSGGSAIRIIPITEWNADISSETGDVTDSESGDWKEKIVAGFKEWSGDYSAVEWDGAIDTPIATELAVQLDINATQYYSGNAIFKTFKTGAKVKAAEAVTISGTFEGNGALTKTRTAV